MSELDPIAHITGLLRLNFSRMRNSFDAIPDDQKTVGREGCSRSPISIIAECGLLNGRVASYLTTGEWNRPPAEEYRAKIASFDTPEKALACLNSGTEQLLAAVADLDPATLGDDCSAAFGRPMTRFAIAELGAVHMSYHDGQLNYLQTLCGDAEMHW